MAAHEEQRKQVIAMLAAGATQAEVAEDFGLGLRTVQRWVADPEFAAEVETQAAAMTRAVHARLKSLAGAAIESLGNIAVRGSKDADRISAAKVILDRVAPATQKVEVKADTLTDAEIEERLRACGFERKV